MKSKCYCHKENRYARGVLTERIVDGNKVLTFTSEKQQTIEVPEGKSGICEKTVYTQKVVDESFFEHFQEITDLELTVIEFEDSKMLTEKQRRVKEEKNKLK